MLVNFLKRVKALYWGWVTVPEEIGNRLNVKMNRSKEDIVDVALRDIEHRSVCVLQQWQESFHRHVCIVQYDARLAAPLYKVKS